MVALLALHATAQSAATTSLKDAYKGDFYLGVAINRTIATGLQDDRLIRNSEQISRDLAVVTNQFNQLSPENDLKWEMTQPRAGAEGYDFGPADAYVNFGLANHMYLVGHVLVWHAQTPNWVFQGTNPPPTLAAPAGPANANPVPPVPKVWRSAEFVKGAVLMVRGRPPAPAPAPAPAMAATAATATNAFGGRRPGRNFGGGFGFNGPRASRAELLQRMHDHIATVVGRYKGKIKVWDVVNEAIADGGTNILRNSLWEQIIGPDFIAKAFEYAHQADPHAILRYNDYSLENTAKRHKLIALIKSLQKQHVPVMAIGSQTHVSVSSPSFEEEDKVLTELETLGLPIHITEFDVNSAQGGQRSNSGDVTANAAITQGGLVNDLDKKLANAYAGLFRAFVKHKKSVKVITFWGVNDGVSWRAQGHPLLFDAHDQPKPAFDAVIRVATGDQPPSP